MPDHTRRTFLAAGTALATTATAGCLSGLTSTPRAPPTVSDRPDAVYVPSHVEGMQMVGMQSAGDYRVGLMYSFPHRFWLVTGTNVKKRDISKDATVHLMATVWDPESKTVLPVGNARTEVTKDGEQVTGKRMWPMLSQNMGVHFGDNVALDGEGAYEVTVSVAPIGATKAGAFQGKFEDGAETTFSFEYSTAKRDEISFTRLQERQGERGAVEPMDTTMPISRVPERSGLPGDPVGQGTSGDGVFYARVLDSPPAGVEGDGPYLLVSARTPYNRYPLPRMGLSTTIDRDGETLFDDTLSAVLHPQAGYHYGTALDSLQSGDAVTLSVGAPPQVSRHEGYETAFLQMDDIEMTV